MGLAAVSLTAVGQETAKIIFTERDGIFAFDSVVPGAYILRIEATGFLSRRLSLSKAATEHDADVGSIMLRLGMVMEVKREKPVTVCESLSDPNQFSGKAVAIVGRLECKSSLVDHTCFLVEDRCEKPVRTDGHAWPNKVFIADYWEEGMPMPPSIGPVIDKSTAVKKLSLLRRSTTFGVHKEPRFKKGEGRSILFSHFADVEDEWGVAYGTFVTAPLQKGDCGTEMGCGGYEGAPAALITLPAGFRAIDSKGALKE